jgi:hypothetical protein
MHRLSPFATTALLGLLTRVDPNHPWQEVCARPSDILEIIQVGRRVAHAVDRKWTNRDGMTQHRCYETKRFSPKKMAQIQKALLELHNQTVVIHRPAADGGRDDLCVHVLDMFGYRYRHDGHDVDLDNLPAGMRRVNVGSAERPVWRLRRCGAWADQEERASGILFRLNHELARELQKGKGTICYTLIAHKVFGVLREFSRQPAAMRLLLLVLRQTNRQFTRQLRNMLEDLGFQPDHPGRAVEQLRCSLERLRGLEVVDDFHIDLEGDRLTVTRNLDWHKGPRSGVSLGAA